MYRDIGVMYKEKSSRVYKCLNIQWYTSVKWYIDAWYIYDDTSYIDETILYPMMLSEDCTWRGCIEQCVCQW